MWNSFTYILENDPEPLCLDFSVNKTVFDEVCVHACIGVIYGSQEYQHALLKDNWPSQCNAPSVV